MPSCLSPVGEVYYFLLLPTHFPPLFYTLIYFSSPFHSMSGFLQAIVLNYLIVVPFVFCSLHPHVVFPRRLVSVPSVCIHNSLSILLSLSHVRRLFGHQAGVTQLQVVGWAVACLSGLLWEVTDSIIFFPGGTGGRLQLIMKIHCSIVLLD